VLDMFENAIKNTIQEILNSLITGIVTSSFWICTFTGVIALIIAAIGFDTRKYAWLSLVVYLLIQTLS